jgi:hypothetical protein
MKRFVLGIFVSICAFTHVDAWAQATAQISGTARDQSGAVLPGVDIKATQTETGVIRDTVTNETGSFVLPNLAIGPYRLEAALPGFRTFIQTGIVLEVNSNPAINVVLEVGQVSEQVEVQANAATVETRNVGVGNVMENDRVMELPLNGRNMIDLLALAPASTPAPIVDGTGGRDPFSKGNVSVAGGLNTGVNFTLDGSYHNNPYDNGYMSMPFPDALQEFKVETGATGAQNGVKSAGTVSMVTKSGTNQFHGDAFEFVRNGIFNARNAFALARDTIKRNQFGGTLGGPVLKNKLFFFGAYQGTTIRTAPTDQLAVVPTAQMLAGDFTAFAACNGATLRGPFLNNRVNPSLFSPQALKLASRLPQTSDPCGSLRYGTPNRENDYMTIARIDYQRSSNHSIFGRYMLDHVFSPPAYDTDHNTLNAIELGKQGMAQAFTLGDTYLFGANVVNAFHLTANRLSAAKTEAELTNAGIGTADIGVNMFNWLPHRAAYTINGGLNVNTSQLRTGAFGPASGPNKVAVFGVNDDVSVLHGNHQWNFGTQINMWWTNSYSNASQFPGFTFNGQTTGLGMADFLMGNVSNFRFGTVGGQNKKSKYIGVYASDTWKATRNLTLTYGLRWEPFFPIVNLDNTVSHFDVDAWRKGIKSSRFAATPAGMLYTGDPGFPAYTGMKTHWADFSPRLGLAWDVRGDGKTSLRASAGSFYDYPSTLYLQAFANAAPFLPIFIRPAVPLSNPWNNPTDKGIDPFPVGFGKSLQYNQATWPAFALVTSADYNIPTMQIYSWNLSLQRQVGTDWLVSATYLGNNTVHMWVQKPGNPAVYFYNGTNTCVLPNGTTITGLNGQCSTTANQNQRRRLSVENPVNGQYFGGMNQVEAGGTASYNGLILDVQRRAGHGITLGANYTLSHCIADPGGLPAIQGTSDVGYSNPDNRRFDRGNCILAAVDRRQVFNLSAVARTPQFSNSVVKALATGWQVSPIFRILAGDPMMVTTTQDRSLTGLLPNIVPAGLGALTAGQRVNQLLANPYGNKTINNYLNAAAFALPAFGTFPNEGMAGIRGPLVWQLDTALARSFQVRESKRIEFRAEAFNLTNSLHINDPITDLGSSFFGRVTSAKDPRIMQFALKYLF